MQQMIYLRTLSRINTRGFHQDLLEVPAGCWCLRCCYRWQEHALVWAGTSCLAGCWALCRHITASPRQNQSCSCRVGKAGNESYAIGNHYFPQEPAVTTAREWARARRTAYQQQHGNAMGKILHQRLWETMSPQPGWKDMDLWAASGCGVADKKAPGAEQQSSTSARGKRRQLWGHRH